MNTTQLIVLLRRMWLLILSCLIVGGATGTVLAFTLPPRYEATAQLYVSAQGSIGARDLAQGGNFVRQAITSYGDVALTSIVLDPVIDGLDLDTTAAALAGRLRITAAATSQIVSVTASDMSPTMAAQLANAVSESLSSVVTTRLERSAGAASSTIRVTTVSPARVPTDPVSPNISALITLGCVLGLTAGIVLATLRTLLDTRVHTVDDAETATGAPVIGGVLHDVSIATQPLVVRTDPRGAQAEAFRRMRTNVRFLDVDGGTPAIVFTSASPGEGKSTTCANLALAFAETGARVALVDADLRRPTLADLFAIEGGAGLSDVLIGRLGLAAAMQRWSVQKLFVLPAGSTPPNPSELLGSEAMARVLDALRASFDIVLIDSPPLLAVTDAALLASASTGAVLVAASGSARIPQLETASHALASANATLLGVVLTRLPARGPDSTPFAQSTYEVARADG